MNFMKTLFAVLLALLLSWSVAAADTPLTEPQYATLKTDITVTSAAEFGCTGTPAVCTSTDDQIAAAYNAKIAAYWVRRTDVTRDQLLLGQSVDGTLMAIGGTGGLTTKTASEILTFQMLFAQGTGFLNAASPNAITALNDILGAGSANATHARAVVRRLGTRAEKLFATGTGSTAANAIMTFEGQLTARDVAHALRGTPLV